MKPSNLFGAFIFASNLLAQNVPAPGALVAVTEKPISRTIQLPGEFLPFLNVTLHAKLPGYVQRVRVDRGSLVKQGERLIDLSAPEMQAQVAEAESKTRAADASRLQAQAQLAGEQTTFDRMKKAAETPGAVAGNELLLAEQRVAAAQAALHALEQSSRAAEAALGSAKALQAYLQISAPFAGVITERFVHPGAFVGPGNDGALLVLQQISRLRLVVPVPEENVGGIVNGASVPFQVPAFPGRNYSGKVARVSHTIDRKTRTMAVELDVSNPDRTLTPGMYPLVQWPVRGRTAGLFVPKTSVVTTTERTFVIRDANGKAEWVDVKKGAPDGDLLQVLGNLKPGDKIVRRGTDEIREATKLE